MLSARLRPITAIPTTPICCFDIVYSCQGDAYREVYAITKSADNNSKPVFIDSVIDSKEEDLIH